METMTMTTKEDKNYPVIYMDVPWADKDWPISRVRGLPLEKWAAEDALMLFWVPVADLPDTLLLLKVWGFEYAGMLVWRRPKSYLEGFGWSSDCEYLLVGKRGTAKTSALMRHPLYEGACSNKEYKPDAFRALLAHSALVAFGELTKRLDVFGSYWRLRYPEYDKGFWDFVEE